MTMTMPNMMKIWGLALLLTTPSCGPGEVAPDCVSVDDQVGIDRHWCEGEYSPLSLEWEGKRHEKIYRVCLPPGPEGECVSCPSAKVIEDVEEQLYSDLAEHRPACQLDHWEYGCMLTVENAMTIGYESDYCCSHVALWGEGCADSP